MLGFKSFEAAQATLVGIELMHMMRKGQLVARDETGPHTSRTVLLPGRLITPPTGLSIPIKICDRTAMPAFCSSWSAKWRSR